MFKRLISFLIVLCLLTLSFTSVVFADDEYKFLINGEETNLLNIVRSNGVYMLSSDSIKNLGAEVFEYSNGSKRAFSCNGMFVAAEYHCF